MHADEVRVDAVLVRKLLSTQFPPWADLTLEKGSSTGTDNAIFRLGPDMGVRAPRIHWAVRQIDKEVEWLGRLAPELPVDVPVPIAKGEPGDGYPYPWLVYPWLEGEDLEHSHVDDLSQLAQDVARFVLALEKVDPMDGPPSRWDLSNEDKAARSAINELEGMFDVNRLTAIWDAALRAGNWNRRPVWAHNDLLPGNVLIRNGRLSGIIDWGAAGVGDPARDAMLAWALPPDARVVYRSSLGFDDTTWTRARGWVVLQCAQYIPYYANTIPDAVAGAKRRLHAVMEESNGV
jgi:aminoglycoside phosphotransferase (APT) family kinase protein